MSRDHWIAVDTKEISKQMMAEKSSLQSVVMDNMTPLKRFMDRSHIAVMTILSCLNDITQQIGGSVHSFQDYHQDAFNSKTTFSVFRCMYVPQPDWDMC